ncbi:hypothetical protein DL98DRAFT_593423 [Cadophora sp. DSE1049]|nr:hypothetical protein DL98DRAFT_593423 [Cadophora sp. DSE1049]
MAQTMQRPFVGGAAAFVPGGPQAPSMPQLPPPPPFFTNTDYEWGPPQMLFPVDYHPAPQNFFPRAGGNGLLPPTGPASGVNSVPFRTYGRKQQASVFEPGVIIAVPYHTIDFLQPPDRPTRDESLSRLGWVHTKERRVVVIDCYNDHCVGIPMATHSHTGLMNQRKSKGEWIGVRDVADPDIKTSDSAHGNIVATRESRFAIPANPQNSWWFKNTSYAHFSCPVSFVYDRGCNVCPCVARRTLSRDESIVLES